VADLDGSTQWHRVLIPQTDTARHFTGNYAFGSQDYNYSTSNSGYEFDFVGQGAVSGML